MKTVKVQLAHSVEYRMYNAQGGLHRDNSEPAIIHDETKNNCLEFYEHNERHNEFGGAIQTQDGQDLAWFLRGYQFKSLEEYELAVFEMNVCMDLVQDILDNAIV